jgi:hypothetical protein
VYKLTTLGDRAVPEIGTDAAEAFRILDLD